MNIRFLLVPLVLVVFALSATAFGQDRSGPRFEGEWVNVDPNSQGVTKIEVSSNSAGYFVRAWGKCHPRDCDWGTTALEPVGTSVGDPSFDHGFAIWDHNFAVSYATLTIGKDALRMEVVTVFKDRSGRFTYRRVEVFRPADQPAAK